MRTTWIIAAAALFAASQAWAIRVANDAAPAAGSVGQAAPAASASAAASHADDSSSLRQGMITSVSAKNDQVEINGSWFKVAAGKTRLFRQGRAVEKDVLAKGQAVKFTLVPGDAERLTLGVIYVP